MSKPQTASPDQSDQPSHQKPAEVKVVQLRPPSRWHDPLRLIQEEAPSESGRIVLWAVSIFFLALIIWAVIGKLDIIATAEGKLVPQTLVKIVQPAEAGVVKQLLVNEGDRVRGGQVLAQLDTTLASAEKAGVVSDLAIQQMQARRIEAEVYDRSMLPKAGDDPSLYAQVQNQYAAHRKAYLDGLEQEKSLLAKAEHERKSAAEILNKLEQTLPSYKRSADAYAKLEKEGFVGGILSAEKQREATEKSKDLDAQRAAVAALEATIVAQHKKISQLQSTYKSELQKELADARARIQQLRPALEKTAYKEDLMELRAPQDGVIKDLVTTTIGAVVQPGTVIMTLVPEGEQLFVDVNIKNEDVGFVQIGQAAQVKLAAYKFQKYGMLTGKVIHISADSTDRNRTADEAIDANGNNSRAMTADISTYKARLQLDSQVLLSPQGSKLPLTAGMQAVAEINQGNRTVLEYLLSPVQKAVAEAARER